MVQKSVLQNELDFFNKKKAELLKLYKGQFVLIKGDKLIGAFTTDGEAYKAGLEQFGNHPFLIKQVCYRTLFRLNWLRVL